MKNEMNNIVHIVYRRHGNNVFYSILFTIILLFYIFYVCGSLCIIEKNTKIIKNNSKKIK